MDFECFMDSLAPNIKGGLGSDTDGSSDEDHYKPKQKKVKKKKTKQFNAARVT